MTADGEGDRSSTAPAMTIFGLILLLCVLIWVLAGCAMPKSEAATPNLAPTTLNQPSSTPNPTDAASTEPPKPEVEVFVADPVIDTALRVDPPTTLPPLDPCGPEMRGYVDSLPYEWGNKAASSEAYRIVATCRGWSQATQDFYRPGIIDDILVGESAQCPYHRGRQLVGPMCAPITPKGVTPGEDSGFFMITSAGWGQNGVVCLRAGYCSPQSIVGSGWTSMDAGLVLIEASGKFPWTWNSWACGYHPLVCSTWPKAWVNL